MFRRITLLVFLMSTAFAANAMQQPSAFDGITGFTYNIQYFPKNNQIVATLNKVFPSLAPNKSKSVTILIYLDINGSNEEIFSFVIMKNNGNERTVGWTPEADKEDVDFLLQKIDEYKLTHFVTLDTTLD